MTTLATHRTETENPKIVTTPISAVGNIQTTMGESVRFRPIVGTLI